MEWDFKDQTRFDDNMDENPTDRKMVWIFGLETSVIEDGV